MVVRLLVYAALLFASWNWNLLGIPDGVCWSRSEPRTNYLGIESQLVVFRLAEHAAHPLAPLVTQAPDLTLTPYRSQFGLTGVALGWVAAITAVPSGQLAILGAAFFAFLTALLVAAVFAAAHRVLGAPTGDVACALAACTPVFLPFAPSLYWATFTLLAPFAVVWCFFPRATSTVWRLALIAAVGLLVMIKALCGYEYITTVILAPLAAAWFHQARMGESFRNRIRVGVGLVASGLMGFGLAMLLHIGQIGVVSGEDGFAVIRERAAARTAANPDAEIVSASGSRLQSPTRYFLAYFDQRAVSTPAILGSRRLDIPLRGVVLVMAAFGVAVAVRWRSLPPAALALAGAVALGLAASVSWQVLAVNHMCVHQHLNLIVYAVPFLPLAYITLGYMLRLAIASPERGRWAGLCVLAAIALTMAATWALAARDRLAHNAARERIASAVAARLAEPTIPRDRAVSGSVDVVRTVSHVPAALLTDYGELDLATGKPRDPGGLLIQGWAIAAGKSGRRPTARVIVVIGESVIPCRELRFRRPDVDFAARRVQPGAGFVLVVPSEAAARGPVRVFAVSEADPSAVTELEVPR